MRPMHQVDSPAHVNETIFNNSHIFAEPLANAYLLQLSHDQLHDLARVTGTSPGYFVRRAHNLRLQLHHEAHGVLKESEK